MNEKEFGQSPDMGKESENVEPIKILMVDDDPSNLKMAKRLAQINDIDIQTFQEADKALDYIEKCLEQNKDLPEIVLADFTLDKGVEDPVIRSGDEFITKFIELYDGYKTRLPQLKLPEIIGISSEKSYNEIMVKAGADNSIDKFGILKYFKAITDERNRPPLR